MVMAIFKFRKRRSVFHYGVVNSQLLLSARKSNIPLGANYLFMICLIQCKGASLGGWMTGRIKWQLSTERKQTGGLFMEISRTLHFL